MFCFSYFLLLLLFDFFVFGGSLLQFQDCAFACVRLIVVLIFDFLVPVLAAYALPINAVVCDADRWSTFAVGVLHLEVRRIVQLLAVFPNPRAAPSYADMGPL